MTRVGSPRARPLDAFIAAGVWPERSFLAALLAVGRRPRGAALIKYLPDATDLVHSLLSMERYAEADVGPGFDADAVARRGRELRRREHRP